LFLILFSNFFLNYKKKKKTQIEKLRGGWPAIDKAGGGAKHLGVA
jgi:hypothetical protein